VKKNITLVENTNEIFKAQQLTIGLDLGDRISNYCILDETGTIPSKTRYLPGFSVEPAAYL